MRNLLARLRSLDAGPADALLGLAFLVEVTIELLLLPHPRPRIGLAYLLCAAMAGAIVGRRRVPFSAAVIGWATFVGLAALPSVYSDRLIGPPFATLLLAYSAGRHAGDRRVIAAGVIGSGFMVAGSSIDSFSDTVANT